MITWYICNTHKFSFGLIEMNATANRWRRFDDGDDGREISGCMARMFEWIWDLTLALTPTLVYNFQPANTSVITVWLFNVLIKRTRT